jgi:hypothetical protein
MATTLMEDLAVDKQFRLICDRAELDYPGLPRSVWTDFRIGRSNGEDARNRLTDEEREDLARLIEHVRILSTLSTAIQRNIYGPGVGIVLETTLAEGAWAAEVILSLLTRDRTSRARIDEYLHIFMNLVFNRCRMADYEGRESDLHEAELRRERLILPDGHDVDLRGPLPEGWGVLSVDVEVDSMFRAICENGRRLYPGLPEDMWTTFEVTKSNGEDQGIPVTKPMRKDLLKLIEDVRVITAMSPYAQQDVYGPGVGILLPLTMVDAAWAGEAMKELLHRDPAVPRFQLDQYLRILLTVVCNRGLMASYFGPRTKLYKSEQMREFLRMPNGSLVTLDHLPTGWGFSAEGAGAGVVGMGVGAHADEEGGAQRMREAHREGRVGGGSGGYGQGGRGKLMSVLVTIDQGDNTPRVLKTVHVEVHGLRVGDLRREVEAAVRAQKKVRGAFEVVFAPHGVEIPDTVTIHELKGKFSYLDGRLRAFVLAGPARDGMQRTQVSEPERRLEYTVQVKVVGGETARTVDIPVELSSRATVEDLYVATRNAIFHGALDEVDPSLRSGAYALHFIVDGEDWQSRQDFVLADAVQGSEASSDGVLRALVRVVHEQRDLKRRNPRFIYQDKMVDFEHLPSGLLPESRALQPAVLEIIRIALGLLARDGEFRLLLGGRPVDFDQYVTMGELFMSGNLRVEEVL